MCDVVGPICESGDYLAKNIALPKLTHGDLLKIENVGAYGYSMASNYNTRLRPAEVAIENGKARLIKNRECFEDIISDEEKLLRNSQVVDSHSIDSHKGE